jgi:Ca-activated chloride channel family protein
MLGSLKDGDVVNLVTFDTSTQIDLESFHVTGNGPGMLPLRRAIRLLTPRGSTNLNAGIGLGYQVARRSYDAGKRNRVIILTDAYANTGQVDPTLIAKHVEIGGQEGIYFSGLGVGADFNEEFLNVLTDLGRGGYFSLVTRTDAQRAFTKRFNALMLVAAKNVRFRLDYPLAMAHTVSASEQLSKNPEDVQPTNFSYNTSQYFFESFRASDVANVDSDTFTLSIFYEDPITGMPRTEVIEKQVSELLGGHEDNLRAAETIYLLTQLIKLKMTPAEVDAVLGTYPVNYSKPLFNEYKSLIERYKYLVGTP